jgi:hypothetical protein
LLPNFGSPCYGIATDCIAATGLAADRIAAPGITARGRSGS